MIVYYYIWNQQHKQSTVYYITYTLCRTIILVAKVLVIAKIKVFAESFATIFVNQNYFCATCYHNLVPCFYNVATRIRIIHKYFGFIIRHVGIICPQQTLYLVRLTVIYSLIYRKGLKNQKHLIQYAPHYDIQFHAYVYKCYTIFVAYCQ